MAIVLWDGFETLVLPRRVTRKIRLTRVFYRTTWRLWRGIGQRMATSKCRDTYLSIFGPLSLFLLFLLWGVSLLLAFGLLYWSTGTPDFVTGLFMSGSSFCTLGIAIPQTAIHKTISVAEAGLGMASWIWPPAGSGCSWSARTGATRHLQRIDQVDDRYLSTDGA